jgi:hypothetical protein
MRGALVEAQEDRTGSGWDVADGIILAHEGADRGMSSNHMMVWNSTSPCASRRIRSMARKPAIPRASIAGMTWLRTMSSYGPAFAGLVHPRQIRQIITLSLLREAVALFSSSSREIA